MCCVSTALTQYNGPAPPRINIPGAIALPALRVNNQQGRGFPVPAPVKVRRPVPQPQEPIFHDEAKPVNEEVEDEQYIPSQPSPPRALFTSEPQDHDVPSNAQRFNIDRPKPAPQQRAQQQQQQQQQAQRPRAHFDQDQRPHQKPHHADDKPKKPVAQILRKYREEHPDGSIT